MNMYRDLGKPIIEFFICLVLLILTSPVFILVTLIQLFVTKGRPFFIHFRPGRYERQIGVIKFRTIISGNGYIDEGQPRTTLFGRFLRITSIDELPQLINVLKGDMSLVGPRPLLTEYLAFYDKEQYRRQEVKPGITGLAQINGRRSIPWQKRFEYDIYYVDNISFRLDLKIILLTIVKVLSTEGAEHREDSYPEVMSYE